MFVLLMVAMILSSVGCIQKDKMMDKRVNMLHRIEDYGVSFLLPSNWKEVKDQETFDLQCQDGKGYFSVFVYRKRDLPEGQSARDVYELQKKAFFSQRQEVKQEEDGKTVEEREMTIFSELFTAKRDGHTNYYYCSLVDFTGESDIFCWTLFTSLPEERTERIKEWDKILRSAKWEKKK